MRAAASAPSRSMLTVKPPAVRRASMLWERWSMQINTRGGSKETEVKAETVSPWWRPSAQLVTTVTLAAKLAMTPRNSSCRAVDDEVKPAPFRRAG